MRTRRSSPDFAAAAATGRGVARMFRRRVRRALCAALVGAAWVAGAPAAGAAQWLVETNGVDFYPQFLTIAAGDSITWINRGGRHNVVADDGSFRCARGCDGDGRGGSGNASSAFWMASVAFPKAGTVGYFCEPHGSPGSGMYGVITVQGAPSRQAVDVPIARAVELAAALALAVAARLALRRRAPRTPG